MGLRFRKRIKLFPGVTLNLNKNGVSSISIGRRGAKVNINNQGIKATLGVPGSGLSYSTKRKRIGNKD